jgi:murein DD-endopeptidase MepM/ murein hydrolase activator NlpD
MRPQSVRIQGMRLRSGVVLLLAAAALASTSAATARADTAGASADANAPADATQSSDAATTTGAADTTGSPSTDASTEAAAGAGSTDAVAAAIPVAQPINRGCVFGGVALVLPNRTPLLIGPIADAPSVPVASMSNLVYPADGSVVTASGITLQGTGCTAGQPAGGKTELRTLSLFDGTVTAELVGLSIGDAGARHTDAITGLAVSGAAVQADDGSRIPLGSWGYLVTGTVERIRTPAATGTEQPPLRVQASALAVHLLEKHAGLPAGTVLLISFAGLPGPASEPAATPMPVQPASSVAVPSLSPKTSVAAEQHSTKKAKGKHKGPLHHAPWNVTPPLEVSHYVFPVTGTSSFVDTYGAFRGDVPGNWHHGDDIFAPLGTPVVAVADGTVNRVGWQRVGGWRIWVVDEKHNRFYYAHLSGYSPAVIHSKTVKAGEVIGFVGNSGDAFTTSPHLHFEIHPRRFRKWGYDGAVDPTRYLQSWSHLRHVHAPRPAHPRLPAAKAARQEARYVFRELLAARGLLKKPVAPARPKPHQPSGTVLPPASTAAAVVAAASQVVPTARSAAPQAPQALPATTTALVGGSVLMLLALSGSTLAVRRKRRPSARAVAVPGSTPPPPVPAIEPAGAAPTEPLRTRAPLAQPPATRGIPLSVVAGTGALVTMSVLVLRRRSERARRRANA